MRDWHPSKPDPNRTDAQIALPHQVEQWQTPSTGNFRAPRWPTPDVPTGGQGLRSGTTFDGRTAYAPDGTKVQLKLHHVAGNWPTPRCEDGECAGGHRGKDDTLYGAIMRPKDPRNWSTPNGDDANNVTRASGEFKSLSRDVQAAWATPAARDFRHPNATDGASRAKREAESPASGDQLPNQIGGALNPAWTCLLMGWPIARRDDGSWWCWTSLEPAPAHAGFPGWPMGMGPHQHPYEPPRIAPKGSVQGRVAQIKAVGNGVCQQQAHIAFGLLLAPAAQHLLVRP